MDGGICSGGGGIVTGGGAEECAEVELDSVLSPFDSSVLCSFSVSESSSDIDGEE